MKYLKCIYSLTSCYWTLCHIGIQNELGVFKTSGVLLMGEPLHFPISGLLPDHCTLEIQDKILKRGKKVQYGANTRTHTHRYIPFPADSTGNVIQ